MSIQRLRRQRDTAIMASILFLVSALAAALPHVLFERRRLQTANENLVSLQQTIKYVEDEIVETQRSILTAQGELRSLNNESRR
jgi:septal ring factor EnvC (AmiA/AmiB activator)